VRRFFALWGSVGVFAATAALGALLLVQAGRIDRAERRRDATKLASASAFAIEQQLSRSLTAPFALAVVVSHAGGARDFDEVAGELLALYGGVDSLQLAPDGVIRFVHPLPGNEPALGLDLLRDPVHGADAREAVATRALIFTGPFRLRQGGEGLAGRVAVFVKEGGGERFWGLASVIIRLPRLLERSRISRLEEAGLAYQLLRRGGDGEPPEVIARSAGGDGPPEEPVSIDVALPRGRWTLAVAPRAGWGAPVPLAGLGAVLVGALALALLAHRVLRQPALLREVVAARTADLVRAHADQRRAEEALRQSQKLEAVGRLAGGVAHDFNNLLAGILGYAELILQEAPPGSLAEEGARTIEGAARRAAELTRQLLAFARMGKQLEVPVDLHQVIGEVARLLERTLDKRIAVVLELAARRPFVRGDPTQLQQVILNLAVNARDAMPEGGTLTIATAVAELGEAEARELTGGPGGPALRLTVQDTGVGIPAPVRDRIFEPFFTTKPEGRGTGLGLATVYGVVRNHGGGVRVESEEGRGARFLVFLPLEAEGPAPEPKRAAAPRGVGRVLVVDDEEVVRRVAGRLLASLGYEPVLAAGPQEAIDWLRGHPGGADAVLLDLVMPGLDGRACFERLRQLEPALPVVISSGFAQDGRAQALLDLGAEEFVQKPYRAAELGQAVARALGRRGGARPGGPATTPGS
jgi:signal transduction histidine kinase/CheY-like chemotaxis protein